MLLIVMAMAAAPGCSDRIDMEDASIPLSLGVDLGPDNKLLYYSTFPVFSINVKKKKQETEAQATTLRQSRLKQDAHSAGVFSGRNYQVFLVGKRLLQQEDWFRMTDVLFRDAKNSVTNRVIAYDGPLSEIVYLTPENQPRLPLILRGMVDTKNARSETVRTTMQELHRQIFEKGMTASIAEVELDQKRNIKLRGTALLDHKGKYAFTLSAPETILLRILQNKANKPVSLTVSIPGEPKKGPLHTDKLSFTSTQVKTKIKTSYREDKFQFDMNILLRIALSERLFPYDVQKKGEELEKLIAEQVKQELEKLIKNIQRHRIDPIGLGIRARAYEYGEYKKVKEDWGEALSRADIHLDVDVKIGAMGPVK